jgi:hypothetical protein
VQTAWLDLPLRAECELDQGEESCRSSCHPRGRGGLAVRAASVTPPAIRLWMTQGWFRMSPAVRQGGVGRCEQSLTIGLPKPITGPCGSSVGYSLRHLCRDTA